MSDKGVCPLQIDKKTLTRIFFVGLGCIFVYWLLHETERFNAFWGSLTGMISPFLIGAALAFVFNVPMRAIERHMDVNEKTGLRRALAILLTLLAFVLVLTVVFLLLIPQIGVTFQTLVPQLTEFAGRMEENVKFFLTENPDITTWLGSGINLENMNWGELVQKALAMVGGSVTIIANGAFSAVGSITGGIVDAVIGLVFALYCLARKEVLARQAKKLLYALLPEKTSDEVLRIFRLTNTIFSSFLSGQCLEAVILGCLFAVAMWIFGMPYITLVSVLVAVTALVPMVGAFIGCALGAFFILVDNPMQALWFVVMFLVIQQIEGNLIYPRVVGTSIGLPGMWVLVAVAIGGELMGVGGMLIMVPLTSVLYTLLREFVNKRLAARGIAPEKLQVQPTEPKPRFQLKNQKNK